MRSEPQALKMNSYGRRALRERIIARDGRQCRFCAAGPDGLELDHIEPLWRRPDLSHDHDNLQVLCGLCHRIKTGAERGALLKHREAVR